MNLTIFTYTECSRVEGSDLGQLKCPQHELVIVHSCYQQEYISHWLVLLKEVYPIHHYCGSC